MPNDPSIPLSVNVAPPKFNTPFEQLGQVYALRGAKLNQDLTQQEINTGQSLEAERRQKVEHGQRVQQAWQDINGLMHARGGTLPTDEEIAPAMTQAGEDPAPYLKESAEQRDRLAKLKASQLKNQEDETNLVAEAMASVAKDGYDPHHFALKVAQLKQGGIDTTLLEKSIQEHPERTKEIIDALAQSNKQQKVADDAQAAADLHAELPSKLPDPVTGLTPSQTDVSKRGMAAQAEAARANRAQEAQARENSGSGGSLVQIAGPNGQPIWVEKKDAIGKPSAQPARGVTGIERQSLAFFNRAKEADDIANKLDPVIAKAGIMAQGRLQYAPNWAQSPENQSYRQAQRAFTEARLRKESGAAIPEQEYQNDARTYFAQPGDGPEVIAQKLKGRQAVLQGLAFSSGKAYEEFYGEPLALPGRNIETPAKVNVKVDESEIKKTGTVKMRAPNGQVADVSADQVEAAKAKGATVIK